ncbi:hypothetical protein EBB07_11870 [Paenibacillaceae bacterium]|nr:hypothetical protein EBB07_11870 [Paenibacillaceae bacterium]
MARHLPVGTFDFPPSGDIALLRAVKAAYLVNLLEERQSELSLTAAEARISLMPKPFLSLELSWDHDR